MISLVAYVSYNPLDIRLFLKNTFSHVRIRIFHTRGEAMENLRFLTKYLVDLTFLRKPYEEAVIQFQVPGNQGQLQYIECNCPW